MATEAGPHDTREGHSEAVSSTGRWLLLLVSIGGAISNIGIIYLVSHSLDVHHNKEFLVFWALLFGMFGVQSGIQNETTRATTAPSPHGPRAIRAGVFWGLLSALVIGATGMVWAPHLLPHSSTAAVVVLACTGALYPIYVTVLGSLGGARQWEWFASSLLVEVGLRVALVLAGALIGASLGGFEGASAAAILTLAPMLLFGRGPRTALLRRADVAFGALLRRQSLAMLSTACTALLINAYPALVAVTTPEESLGLPPSQAAALMGGCMLAVSLTRAPIMMPLTVFVGVAISAFTGHRGSVWAAVRRPFSLLLLVGFLGGAAAWPIGPWILRIFKPEYDLPGWYFAALVVSSVFMAWLTILGAIALATEHHGLYALGWGLASATGVGSLLLPLHLTLTTLFSVSLGPLAGCAFLFVALQRIHRSSATPPPETARGDRSAIPPSGSGA